MSVVGSSAIALAASAQQRGRGQGRGGWVVNIGSVSEYGITIGLNGPGNSERNRNRRSRGGPRVIVRFEGPSVREVPLAPGGGGQLFFDAGTWHASARPENANQNASGSIPVRGPNPFTIERDGAPF